METSLHRDLKTLYARGPARFEVSLGGYRIDVVDRDRLIEIQHGSLAAIRDKVRDLLGNHQVLVVKPIVAGKLLVKREAKGGAVASRCRSPLRGGLLDLFDELVHFTRVFPHPRLSAAAEVSHGRSGGVAPGPPLHGPADRLLFPPDGHGPRGGQTGQRFALRVRRGPQGGLTQSVEAVLR